MGLYESEVMDDRSLIIENLADDAERRGRLALGEVNDGGCIADLAGGGSLCTQRCKRCASLVEHPESCFRRERPTSHLSGQCMLAGHRRLHLFGSAEFLQRSTELGTAHMQHARREVHKQPDSWLRIPVTHS